jgi:hypothetical protein
MTFATRRLLLRKAERPYRSIPEDRAPNLRLGLTQSLPYSHLRLSVRLRDHWVASIAPIVRPSLGTRICHSNSVRASAKLASAVAPRSRRSAKALERWLIVLSPLINGIQRSEFVTLYLRYINPPLG